MLCFGRKCSRLLTDDYVGSQLQGQLQAGPLPANLSSFENVLQGSLKLPLDFFSYESCTLAHGRLAECLQSHAPCALTLAFAGPIMQKPLGGDAASRPFLQLACAGCCCMLHDQSKAFSSPQARYASSFGRVLKPMLTSHHHSSIASHSAMSHVYIHD